MMWDDELSNYWCNTGPIIILWHKPHNRSVRNWKTAPNKCVSKCVWRWMLMSEHEWYMLQNLQTNSAQKNTKTKQTIRLKYEREITTGKLFL